MTPEQLRSALVDLARNLRWTWHHRTAAVLDALPTARPERHPLETIRTLSRGNVLLVLVGGDSSSGDQYYYYYSSSGNAANSSWFGRRRPGKSSAERPSEETPVNS